MTTKSTKNQTHPYTDIWTEIDRALLRTCGCGLVLGSQLERVSVLVEEIRVFGLIGMNLCACGSMLVAKKDACGGLSRGKDIWLWGREWEVVGEGEASFHPWRWQCLQEWRERVLRFVKREIREIIKKKVRKTII